MQVTWDFSPVWEYRAVIAHGLLTSFVLTLAACVAGTLAGLGLSLLLVAQRPHVRRCATAVVELLRACPPLVLLIWTYYLLPALTTFAPSSIATAFLVFTIVFAVFAADVFRGSIEAIPVATIDSARSLGMDRRLLARRVIIPEVARRSFPALNALVVSTLKMSSLASVIAVPELTYAAQLILAQRPRAFEIYTATAVAYAIAVLPTVVALRWLERLPTFALNPTSHAQRQSRYEVLFQ